MKSANLSSARHKKWEIRKAILEVIVIGALSGGGSPLRPALPLLVNTIIKLLKMHKQISIDEKKIQRTLEGLEKSDLVWIEEKGKEVRVRLRNNSTEVIKYSIETLLNFKIQKKKWNGKWYMLFFDVPEIQRNKRDYLRKYLRKIGFYQYQKSVYIFPFECENEVLLIKKIVAGGMYMKYIIADKIEDEDKIKRHFNLK